MIRRLKSLAHFNDAPIFGNTRFRVRSMSVIGIVRGGGVVVVIGGGVVAVVVEVVTFIVVVVVVVVVVAAVVGVEVVALIVVRVDSRIDVAEYHQSPPTLPDRPFELFPGRGDVDGHGRRHHF